MGRIPNENNMSHKKFWIEKHLKKVTPFAHDPFPA